MLLQRVAVGQRPAQEVLNVYFYKGLSKGLRTALATMDTINNPLEDLIAQALLAGESLDDDDSTNKHRSKRKSSKGKTKTHRKDSLEEDSDTESTTSSSKDGSSDDSEPEHVRVTRKSHKSGKVNAASVGKTSAGKSAKDIWCSRCRNPGHEATDCAMNEKWCAICTSHTHNTMECYYNRLGQKACTQNATTSPGNESGPVEPTAAWARQVLQTNRNPTIKEGKARVEVVEEEVEE